MKMRLRCSKKHKHDGKHCDYDTLNIWDQDGL